MPKLVMAIFSASAIIATSIFMAGGLNYNGVCLADFKKHTETEQINSAILYFIERPVGPDSIKGTSHYSRNYFTGSEYDSPNDLLSKHPDCCFVENAPDVNEINIAVEDRLFGVGRMLVRIKFDAEVIVKSTNAPSTATFDVLYLVSNCGDISQAPF